MKISAVIITYNEMGYIERCIDSVSFADEIVVVDSYSSDGTYEYLLAHPRVKAIQHPFQDFTKQKTFAMKQASNDWLLFLDADEVVPATLRQEILDVVQSSPTHAAFWFYRKFMFKNVKLRYSGWQTDKNYRLFRKSKVTFCRDRMVHECLEIEGTSGILKERLLHYSYKRYEDYKAKMLHYGQLKALQCHENGRPVNRLKLLVAPFWKFFYNYTVRLGFLDGKKGLIICYLNALSDYQRYREFRQLNREDRQLQDATLSTATE
ncbi:MAG TPA: glycosyltransferase family 2 protein [Pricia sp.]|nr:glycosyltransferase family 2 protein [Pricia sp.]